MSTTILSVPIALPMSHDRIQQECFSWLWNQYPELRRTFFHCPNELPRQRGMSPREHMIILAQRQAVGVLKGVTDLIFYHAGVLYMFNIKIGKDILSEAQLLFISAMEAQGGKFFEINSLDKFQTVIKEIL